MENVRLWLKGKDKKLLLKKSCSQQKKKIVVNNIAERQKSLDSIQTQFKTFKKKIIPLWLDDFSWSNLGVPHNDGEGYRFHYLY